jgi:hypothetical protein
MRLAGVIEAIDLVQDAPDLDGVIDLDIGYSGVQPRAGSRGNLFGSMPPTPSSRVWSTSMNSL